MTQLTQLTNEELKDKILETNNKQLSKIGLMSFCFFLSGSGKVIQDISEKNFLKEIKDLEEKKFIIEKFNTIVTSFKLLQTDVTVQEVDKEIESLLKVRKTLYNLSNTLHAYEIELLYVKELLDHSTMNIVAENEYNNIPLNKKDIDFLISKIDDLLDSNSNDNHTFISLVSNILSIMPFRMSKLKYFNIIKENLMDTLIQYPVSMAEYKIKEYKMEFDSSLMGDYGIVFTNYFAKIKSFKNKDLEKLSLPDLEDMLKDIIELDSEIKKLKMNIDSIGILVNRVIVMFLIKDKIDLDHDLEKLLLKWEKLQIKGDKDLLEDIRSKSSKALEETENQLLKNIDYFQSINNEGLNRENFFHKDLDEKVLFAQKVLTYYNDIKFTKYEVLFLENSEIIDRDYLEQLIESLLQYIDRSTKRMNNLERKIRMRRLLSILELPFRNFKEFLSYVEYSLDHRIVNKEEILFTISIANYWLDEFKKYKDS